MRLVSVSCIAAAAIVAASPTAGLTQTASPSVTAYVRGVKDEARARQLEIRKLAVAVHVRGAIAETVIEMQLFATTSEPVEGQVHVDLPQGAVVTGYALDINGTMVDASLVDAPKAKAAYEQQVRRGVDPGLAEVDATGGFNTRVSPIDSKKGRTFRLRFIAPIGEDFDLPMKLKGGTTNWNVQVAADPGTHVRAMLNGKPLGPTGLAGTGALDGSLTVDSVTGPDALISRHGSGDLFLQASGTLPESSARRGGTLRILWDRSRSRRDHDHQAELRRVQEAIETLAPASIEWVAFSSGKPKRETVSSFAEIQSLASAVRYGGATSFSTLEGMAPADTCLLVSDGRDTLAHAPTQPLPCRLFVITSDRSADRARLGRLTAETGGRMVTTGTDRFDWQAPSVEAVVDAAGNLLDFVSLPAEPGRWSIAARTRASGPVRIRVGGTTVERTPGSSAQRFDGEGALIAATQLATLESTTDRKQFVALSRRYAIASPSLSFVVLETPEDYVRNDIAPPANYPKLAVWKELRAEADEDAQEVKNARFATVLRQWQEQVAWWGRKFDLAARPKSPVSAKPGPVPAASVLSAPPPPPPPAAERDGPDDGAGEIVVTGTRRELTTVRQSRRSADATVDAISAEDVGYLPDRSVNESLQRVPAVQANRGANSAPGDVRVSVAAWRPQRDYLDAFDASPAAFDKTFAEWDRKAGDVPSFYLDTADWLARHERHDLAIETLLSALDLPTANLVTVGMVAARLERYGLLDQAIALRERQVQLDPDRPQPRRLLALVLAKRAALGGPGAKSDYERAIRLLVEIALAPLDSRWEGIELISLVEANAFLPRLRAVGGHVELDPRLVRNLDSDVRVVIDWSNDDADIDLWVDEPNGERAIYNYPQTLIGGHLSNDMTDGYGPEEYFIRRAARGRFVVQANVFAPDELDPNGPSRVTAHLYRDWGRPTERVESIDLELKKGQQGQARIGTLTVETLKQ